ncbi:MAG TPA: hypothetical protein VD907_06670 [Verrucomicrobiae bacterium]|nr:hypothetical protein [Verrucomicrobiae bacterium]
MPTRIDAELGLNAKKFISGMEQATSALEAFKSKADFAGSRVAISIRKASEEASKGAREIKTEFSDSAQEVAAALKRSGAVSENWSQGVTSDMQAASKAFSDTSAKVATSLDRASKSLRGGFGRGVIHPSMYADLRLMDRSLQNISLEATHAGNAIQQSVGRKSVAAFNGGSNAALSFSQIIQDAPYGIRGVANNITQLTTNLGYMAASAKAAGISMKSALLGSLANPATLAILGVSVLTTGLQLFSDRAAKAKKKTDELGASVKGLADFLRESEGSAQAEIIALTTLRKIAEDETQTRKDRIAAVNEMRDKYPTLLKNFSDEEVIAGEAATAYGKLAAAITAASTARAYQDAAIDVAKRRLQTEASLAQTIEDRYKAERDLANLQPAGGDTQAAGVNLYDITRRKDLEEQIANFKKSEAAYAKQLNQESRQQIQYGNQAYEALKKADGAIQNFLGDGKGAKSETRKELEAIDASFWRLEKGITDIYAMSVGTRMAAGLVNISQQVQGVAAAIAPTYTAQGEMLAAAFNEGFSEILRYGIEDGIGSVAAALGEALVNGGNVVNAAGGALLGALGGVLVDLGKMAIAVGIGLESIKTALKSLHPAVAIGAGVALVALGSAFAAKSRSLSGTIGNSGGGASSGSTGSSTTTISPANTSGIAGTVVFEIAGRSLVGILKREAQHGNRITP